MLRLICLRMCVDVEQASAAVVGGTAWEQFSAVYVDLHAVPY